MVIEKPEKAARDTLMVYTRCRSHGKVSIQYLVTVAVVG